MARKVLLLFSGFVILSLAANIVFLLSCITPTVKDIALYRVNVTQLAQNLQTVSLNNSRNVARLIHPALPSYWYWGISGVCDAFESPSPKEGTRKCRRAFPPTQNLLTLLEESLRDSLDDDNRFLAGTNNDTDQIVRDVISSWNATITKPRVAAFLRAKEDGLAIRLKASVGLAIAAVILDFGIAIVAPCLFEELNKALSSWLLLSGLVALGAGISAVLSMSYGVRGAAMSGESGGSAIIVVFVGVAIRILPMGMGLFSPRAHRPPPSYPARVNDYWPPPPGPPGPILPPNPPHIVPGLPPQPPGGPDRARREEIGYAGEKYIFELLKRHGIPGWSAQNWTSKFRGREYEAFTDWEGDYADFTYPDQEGHMRGLVASQGALLPHWQHGATYHLEVKSTTGNCENMVHVSPDQVRKMRLYENDPLNAYILVRVYYVESPSPRIKWFSNPLDHPDVELSERVAGGGYKVTCRTR
ncbi:hypothetical protein QBC43DRAFT_285162 [Cladorrhinum sp. PSN259]|nr:hypothetical protein QBC43DRAFT_285162 [Cladorrhinum sp. PSN259]